MPKQTCYITIKSFLAALLCFFSQWLFAQKAGKVEGSVFDKDIPLEFVTITMFKLADTGKAAYYTASDTLGSFAINEVEYGDYLIKFRLIGYKSTMQKISVTASSPITFENYVLEKDANFLQTVTVTSQKKLIEKTPRGFIVNAAANITATGGTATDILKNTPTVSVDAEGTITLRGKTPLILINGRNSNLSNPDQIPASSVETMEIINNPTATYDANAESGIIKSCP